MERSIEVRVWLCLLRFILLEVWVISKRNHPFPDAAQQSLYHIFVPGYCNIIRIEKLFILHRVTSQFTLSGTMCCRNSGHALHERNVADNKFNNDSNATARNNSSKRFLTSLFLVELIFFHQNPSLSKKRWSHILDSWNGNRQSDTVLLEAFAVLKTLSAFRRII